MGHIKGKGSLPGSLVVGHRLHYLIVKVRIQYFLTSKLEDGVWGRERDWGEGGRERVETETPFV